jgi:hypothetical protein
MKYIAALLVLVLVLVSPVMAAIIEEPIGKETIVPIETKPIYEVKPVTYSDAITIIERTVMKFKELIGLQPEITTETINEVNVEIDGQVIAVIPADSKFNGIEVHAYCLDYQYGTDNWYTCEQGLMQQ